MKTLILNYRRCQNRLIISCSIPMINNCLSIFFSQTIQMHIKSSSWPLTFFCLSSFVSRESKFEFVHLMYWIELSLLGHKSIRPHSSSYSVSFALWPAMLIPWSIPAAKPLLLPFGWFNSLPSPNVHPGIRKCSCVSSAGGPVHWNEW